MVDQKIVATHHFLFLIEQFASKKLAIFRKSQFFDTFRLLFLQALFFGFIELNLQNTCQKN